MTDAGIEVYYETESYIDPEDDARYQHFKKATEDLQDYAGRLEEEMGKCTDLPQLSIDGVKGDYADQYLSKGTELIDLVSTAVSGFEDFINELNTCISTASTLAAQYEKSRHRTRRVRRERRK